jgi:hypothetical protein
VNDPQGIAATFNRYFDGINSGDYATAYAQLDPNNHPASGEPGFAQGDSTSYDSQFRILSATQTSPTHAHVALQFVSLQRTDKGPDGDTCDTWTLDYHLVQLDGSWYIHATNGYGGGANHTSC